MKTETFKGTVESAYGKQLPSAVSFSGSFEAFESYDEVAKANELPSNDDVVNIVNAKRKAAARAKATTEALQAAGIEKPDTSSPEYVRESMVKSLMKLHNLSEENARKIVESMSAAASQVA